MHPLNGGIHSKRMTDDICVQPETRRHSDLLQTDTFQSYQSWPAGFFLSIKLRILYLSNYISCHWYMYQLGRLLHSEKTVRSTDQHPPAAEEMMFGRVGALATVAGVSLGSIWLLDSNHNQQKLESTLQRLPWTLRAAEEQQRLPRVYFIIRFGCYMMSFEFCIYTDCRSVFSF